MKEKTAHPATPIPGATAKNSQTQAPARQEPYSIAFWKTEQGLLVTTSNDQGTIWKTTDGRQHWSKVYESHESLNNVVITGGTSAKVLVGEDLFVNYSAPTQAKIWALCDGQAGAGQMTKEIAASVDGGKTWSKEAEVGLNGNNTGLALNGYPEGIDFISNGNGWLWEARGYAYFTNDGGQHWTPFASLTSPESKEARSMSLLDSEHGYALLWDNDRYRLMFTADNGQSWQEVNSLANYGG